MMNDVGRCPNCQGWVRLPRATAFGRLQCPLCQTDFACRQWQAEDLPWLKVLPANEVEAPEPGSVPWPAAASDHPPVDDRWPQRLPSDPDAPDRAVLPATGVISEDRPAIDVKVEVPSPFVKPTVTQRARGGPRLSVELTKIVAGGVVGLLIAQLILWWLPGKYRRDPLKLAPRIPAWMQFVLPGDLQMAQSPPPPDRRTVNRLPVESSAPAPHYDPFATSGEQASREGQPPLESNPFADESTASGNDALPI